MTSKLTQIGNTKRLRIRKCNSTCPIYSKSMCVHAKTIGGGR